MGCSEMFELLNAYVQGTITVEESKLVKTHLASCIPCQDIVRSLKAETLLLKEASKAIKPSFEPGSLKALLQDITVEQGLKTRSKDNILIPSSPRRSSYLSYILAIAAGVLITMALFTIFSPTGTSAEEINSLKAGLTKLTQENRGLSERIWVLEEVMKLKEMPEWKQKPSKGFLDGEKIIATTKVVE